MVRLSLISYSLIINELSIENKQVTAGESYKWKRTKKPYSPIDDEEQRDNQYNGFDNEMSSSGT